LEPAAPPLQPTSPAALSAPPPTKRAAPEHQPGQLAVIAALIEAGHELNDADRALLEQPEAQAMVTPRRLALARATVRDAVALALEVATGNLSLQVARTRAGERARNARRRVLPPAAKTPPAPVKPTRALSPHDVIEHGGEKHSIREWSDRAGFTTCGPLIAMLRAGQSMGEALQHAAH
jgi:hypothetical protein